MTAPEPGERLPLGRLFSSFFILGSTAFGGPAILRHMKELTVTDRHWLREAEFREGLALCQSLPGATGMQMAAFVGRRARGLPGALAAYLGFGLPAILLMLLLSVLYQRYRDLRGVLAVFTGFQVMVVAIIAHAAVAFGRDTLKSAADAGIALAAGLLFALAVHPLAIVVAAALAGVVLMKGAAAPPPAGHATPPRPRPRVVRGVVLVLLVVLVAATLLFLADRPLFDLAAVMFRVDLFAFGGGFGALPIMFREVVVSRGWLDGATFTNGIAMGQVTPGPIVVTATFVGYLRHGLAGALVATVAVFTPSFVLLVAAAPFLDRFKRSPYLAPVTRGIYVSFVGLLGFMAFKVGAAVPWDTTRALLAVTVLLALWRRLPLPGIVATGALVSPLLFG